MTADPRAALDLPRGRPGTSSRGRQLAPRPRRPRGRVGGGGADRRVLRLRRGPVRGHRRDHASGRPLRRGRRRRRRTTTTTTRTTTTRTTTTTTTSTTTRSTRTTTTTTRTSRATRSRASSSRSRRPATSVAELVQRRDDLRRAARGPRWPGRCAAAPPSGRRRPARSRPAGRAPRPGRPRAADTPRPPAAVDTASATGHRPVVEVRGRGEARELRATPPVIRSGRRDRYFPVSTPPAQRRPREQPEARAPPRRARARPRGHACTREYSIWLATNGTRPADSQPRVAARAACQPE